MAGWQELVLESEALRGNPLGDPFARPLFVWTPPGYDAALVEKARGLFEDLRKHMTVEYDSSAAIGKRYRRQDEIGTPWAMTIDHQTLEDGTVTVRDRDSLQQERIPIGGVRALLLDRLEQPWSPRNHEHPS